jgi:hypothetical protein
MTYCPRPAGIGTRRRYRHSRPSAQIEVRSREAVCLLLADVIIRRAVAALADPLGTVIPTL